MVRPGPCHCHYLIGGGWRGLVVSLLKQSDDRSRGARVRTGSDQAHHGRSRSEIFLGPSWASGETGYPAIPATIYHSAICPAWCSRAADPDRRKHHVGIIFLRAERLFYGAPELSGAASHVTAC